MAFLILIISHLAFNKPEFVAICAQKLKVEEVTAQQVFGIMDYDSSGYVTKQKFLILQLYHFEPIQSD